jgi:hypothetical protein
MSARNRQMHFGLLMTANGSHFGGWRLPQADPAASFRLQHYVEMTREAERGCFDLVFMADTLALIPTQLPATLGHAPPNARLEPLTLLSALSAVTTHIGLAGSATTTYNHPYQVAQLFASLGHWVLCGTALRIADTLEEWFQGGAAVGPWQVRASRGSGAAAPRPVPPALRGPDPARAPGSRAAGLVRVTWAGLANARMTSTAHPNLLRAPDNHTEPYSTGRSKADQAQETAEPRQ